MSDVKYPENYVEFLVRDPDDPEYGRLLVPGEPLPGGWSIDGVRIAPEELRARAEKKQSIPWQGPNSWRTQHGQAMVAWCSGNPICAWNTLLADGRRAKALKIYIDPKRWRRTADGASKKYQWGELEIADDDVVFNDVDAPRYEPPIFEGKPNLEIDIAADSAFISDLSDLKFALAAWAELHYECYVRLDGEQIDNPYIGRDGAAWLIAGLRRLDEEVSDFKWWHITVPDAELTALRSRVRTHLRRMGWRREFEK